MKRTELKEIKGLDIKELTNRIGNAKKELAGMVIERSGKAAAKGSKDVKLTAKKRRDIAQMLTILRQKQLLEELVNTSEVKSKDKTEVDTSEVSEVKSRKSKVKKERKTK